MGHAVVHRGRRVLGYNHGHYYPVHLRSVVHVLRPCLRYPVPTANYGSPLQTPLQHVRLARRVHSRVLHTDGRRRTVAGPEADDTLPRVGRRETIVPVQDHCHALLAVHVGLRLVVHKVSRPGLNGNATRGR